jgi:hypothetical protein
MIPTIITTFLRVILKPFQVAALPTLRFREFTCFLEVMMNELESAITRVSSTPDGLVNNSQAPNKTC